MDATQRRRLQRLLAALALAVAAVVVAVVAIGADDGGHRVTVTVKEATNVVPGQPIRMSGVSVGEITKIEPIDRGRAAKLELRLEDRAWPLPAGTRMSLRWGGTASFSNRYILLERAKNGPPAIPEGGAFPAKDFVTPVEFDQLLATFPQSTRADVRDLLDQAGPALHAAKPGLRETLKVAPPALAEASFVLRDLDADQRALATLVQSADRVLGAVDASQPGLRELLSGAGGTFDAIADEATALERSLDRAPHTFARARTTLARADGTLVAARKLTGKLAPGVSEVRRIAQPLNSVLGTVREVGPDAQATLATARTALPDLNPLLKRVTELSPQLQNIGKQSVENLNCIRPFTPDILSFFSNWGDFHSGGDGKDKFIRAQVQSYGPAFSNVSGYNSAEAARLFKGLEYGFPRPPGYNAGQPWFLPECGLTEDVLDPTKDPESRK